jgi:heme exporter protein A
MTTKQLEAVRLECVRGYRRLFSNLSLQLNPGEVLQVEGANGSGKTSLLRILSGLSMPAEGEVLWAGNNIRQYRGDYFRDMKYVGHANGIKADLTPVENLDMTRRLAVPSTRVSSHDALECLGIVHCAHMPTGNLSAGQQRRVALARLLVTQGELWILDEPFTSLDKHARELVENMIDEHACHGGMAIITTHHPLQPRGFNLQRIELAA